MERTSDFEQLLFLYKTDGNSLAPKFNMRWELEAQETTSEPVQEYLSIDKITLVKMLLASKEENKKLHDKLDQLTEMQRQLNKTNDQYADLLVELK